MPKSSNKDSIFDRKGLVLNDATGNRYLSNSKDNDFFEKVLINLRKNYPAVTFTVKPFYVGILRYDSKTRKIISWEEREGYSLWYQVADVSR